MLTISASKFKAKCLGLLDLVNGTGQTIVITKRGVPVAQLRPIPPEHPRNSGFGCMAGTVEELADIVEPIPESWADWEVLR